MQNSAKLCETLAKLDIYLRGILDEHGVPLEVPAARVGPFSKGVNIYQIVLL